MKIRDQRSGDDVAALITDAFAQPDEAALVAALSPEFALVAEEDDELIGHIVFSCLEAPFRALALAPLSVSPMWQRQGVGSALMRAGIARAKGWDAIIVLGEPDYYRRFGFSVELAAGYACAYAGDYLMVLPLVDNLPATGRLIYPQAFSALS